MFDGQQGGNRLIGCLRPFSTAQVDSYLPEGQTIEEMILAAGGDRALIKHGHVWINDAKMEREPFYVPRDRWRVTRPKPGMTVTVRVIPGGGRGGGKLALQIILTIVVIVAAVYTGGLAAGYLGPLWGMSAAGTAALGAGITAAIGLGGVLFIGTELIAP